MDPLAISVARAAEAGAAPRSALLALPALLIAAEVALQTSAGPFWIWHGLDPDYFYLLDALNLVNLTTPGHVAHPGVTVDVLGALTLALRHLGAGADAITAAVLAQPEAHLRLISSVFVALNGAALLVLGAVGFHVFGSLVPALILQSAPFLSTTILKQAFHVRPETLLVLAVLMLAALIVAALGPGALARRRTAFALAFAATIGFGVATKVTFAPLWLAPVFLLGHRRTIVLYAVASAAAVLFFTLPAAGAWGTIADWLGRVLVASGAHGQGAPTVIDLAQYPGNVLKLMGRPVFLIVLLASVASLALAWRRRRRGAAVPELAVRALAGVTLAQLVQILIVAKHPNAIYTLPALMLSALAAALVWRIAADLTAAAGRGRRIADAIAIAVLIVVAVVHGRGYVQLKRELGAWHTAATRLDDDRFAACARVYFLHASSPSFAFYLASHVTGGTFVGRLRQHTPANDFWLENWWQPDRVTLRDWSGPRSLGDVVAGYPCVYFRGTSGTRIRGYLADALPAVALDDKCSTGAESVFTLGVDCDGRVRAPGARPAGE